MSCRWSSVTLYSRAREIGSEQAVPPGEGEAEVAIRLRAVDRMVHAMHVRRNDHEPEQPVRRLGYPQIRVAPERSRIQHDLEHDDARHRRAEHSDGGGLEPCRQQELDGVKAHAGRHVQFRVGVVDAVQSPERGERVKQHVLQVDREVEEHGRRGDADPNGHGADGLEQSPAPGLRQASHGDSAEERRHSHQDRAHDDEPQVADPSSAASHRPSATGPQRLERGEQREADRERRDPDHRLGQIRLHAREGSPASCITANPMFLCLRCAVRARRGVRLHPRRARRARDRPARARSPSRPRHPPALSRHPQRGESAERPRPGLHRRAPELEQSRDLSPEAASAPTLIARLEARRPLKSTPRARPPNLRGEGPVPADGSLDHLVRLQ